MALRPNVDIPIFGYFVTPSFEEVCTYVLNVLNHHRMSCVFILHSSAIFTKDNESQELHLPLTNAIILDPQMTEDIIYEILENQQGLSQETELYTNIEGSGWSFCPGTVRFWFKIYPCQPNEPPEVNSQNSTQYEDPPDDAAYIRPREYNKLLYCIVEYFARKELRTVPRHTMLRYEFLEIYNRGNTRFAPSEFEVSMTLQDLPEWHREMNFLNIRVFSMRGNVLYAKRFSPENDYFIDLYINSNNQFALILNLWSFFKKKYDRMFCMTCMKWKKHDHTHEQVKISKSDSEVFIPDIPYGRCGLVGYADFESIIREDGHHFISGWGSVFIDQEQNLISEYYMNHLFNPQLIPEFLKYISNVCSVYATGDGNIPETPSCQICDIPLTDSDAVFLGRNFINAKIGSHHDRCWFHPKNSAYIFFHNFRGYDSHFLISKIVADCEVVGLVASSFEKFNMISIIALDNPTIRITFKDTFNFFVSSLAKCVSMVQEWKYSPEEWRNAKGIFPYDWFDSYDKLKETSLPPSPWPNNLTNQETDATEAFAIWERKKFKTFAEYHDYYMMADVYQLCDVFEEFRRTCIKEFNTDPAHFQGSPSLTWYLGLCQNPELFSVITETDVYMDIQNSIRGGISQAMTRYINVEDKPNESLFFLDVNSLYSKCMTYKMPGKFIRQSNILPDDWRELYASEGSLTAFMVVDLYYPEHLHDRDYAYPLAPHKYNDRLCTTFKRKTNYMVHAEMLKFYLDRGMVLEQFYYMYIFRQDYALRDYVQGNIEKRRHTKSEVMKTLYKLLNNSLYGKTCENVNKYRNFIVVKDESLYEPELDEIDRFFGQFVNMPTNSVLAECTNMTLYGTNFLAEQIPKEVKLTKPIQIGFAILEFAKREIYNFLAIVQDHFGDKVVPVYTDTDSLLFWCDFAEPWKHFLDSPLKPYLDFEKVPEHWNVFTPDTNKQSGLWSPEADGKEIVEYCGLRAKCYCYRFRDNTTVIKNKGIPKSAMISDNDDTPREEITMQHYRNALFNGQLYKVSQYSIRSFKHDVITLKQYKLGLSANDLKRAITSNRAVSLPFGYKGEKFAYLTTDDQDIDNYDQ